MTQQQSPPIALVTGGASGIGRALVLQLIKAGLTTVVADSDAVTGAALREEIDSDRLHFEACDVADEANVKALVDDLYRRFGRLDLLVNNAGVMGRFAPIWDLESSECDRLLSVNLGGVIHGLRAALPRMIQARCGVIINIGSFVGTAMPVPDAAIYGATKAAVISLSAAMASAYAGSGIRCYAVCPWVTDTPMLRQMNPSIPRFERVMAMMNPSRKMASPDDVAGVILALFENRLHAANGSALLVDHAGATSRLGFQVEDRE